MHLSPQFNQSSYFNLFNPKMLEFIASLLTGVSVWLVVKRNILAFPTGIVGVLLSVPVLFSGKLYGDMALQLFFGAMQIHGWLIWSRGEKAADERIAIRRLTGRNWAIGAAAVLIGTAVFGFFLDEKTDSPLPYVDSFTTVASVAAQIWMNLRYLENWYLWLIVDIIYVPMLLSRGLKWMAILYASFLVMAVFGLLEWKKRVKSIENPV